MARRGNPCDNAMIESFLKTLKVEAISEHETLQLNFQVQPLSQGSGFLSLDAK